VHANARRGELAKSELVKGVAGPGGPASVRFALRAEVANGDVLLVRLAGRGAPARYLAAQDARKGKGRAVCALLKLRTVDSPVSLAFVESAVAPAMTLVFKRRDAHAGLAEPPPPEGGAAAGGEAASRPASGASGMGLFRMASAAVGAIDCAPPGGGPDAERPPTRGLWRPGTRPRTPPAPPPSPRTKRTRLVLPPVPSGHVSSFPPY